jgi:DNA polymerase I-like protein with 3'-5' exonuclease and polymerase domains
LIYEIQADKVSDMAPKIKKIMNNILSKDKTKGVPIIANCESGLHWGEMKPIENKSI